MSVNARLQYEGSRTGSALPPRAHLQPAMSRGDWEVEASAAFSSSVVDRTFETREFGLLI